MELNKIFLGDCFDVMKTFDDKSFQLILCDLPYGISKKTGYTNNSKENTHYIAKYGKHSIEFGEWDNKNLDLNELSSECFRLLKDGGVVVLFYDCWGMSELKKNFSNFKQHRIIQWVKKNPIPINSKVNFLNNAIEFAFTCCKKGNPIFNATHHNGVLNFPICQGKERTTHKTQKPIKLFNEIINIYTNENDTVLDCCAGSFTTAISCLETKRNYMCIEKNADYYKIGKDRILQYNKIKQKQLF